MSASSNQSIKDKRSKICSECGTMLSEKVDNYLMECDYCLSKKTE